MKVQILVIAFFTFFLFSCKDKSQVNKESVNVAFLSHSQPEINSDLVSSNQDSAKIEIDTTETELVEKIKKVAFTTNKSIPKVKRGLDSLFDLLSTKTQSFKINTEESNFIEGKEGTVIFIPNDAFGKLKNIKVTLKESYSKSSYLFDCLSTQTSKGENLETAGMVEVKAYTLDNKELALANGKSIKIHFPTNEQKKKGFRLFNEELSKDSVIEWKFNINGTPDMIIRELTFSSGGTLYSYGFKRDIDFLTLKEIELLKRRTAFYSEFPLRVNREIDSVLTFKRDGYEDDIEFFKVLRKIYTNLEGRHKKHQKTLEENSRLYIRLADKSDTLSRKDYKKRFEEFYANRKDVKIKDWELQRYILSSNKLGWINCDRFYNDPRRKVQVNIVSNSKNETFMLYLKDANAAVRAIKTNKYSRFNGMPYEALGTIIGVKYENGKVFLAKKNIKISSKPLEKFRYKEIALEKLSDEINKLAIF